MGFFNKKKLNIKNFKKNKKNNLVFYAQSTSSVISGRDFTYKTIQAAV